MAVLAFSMAASFAAIVWSWTHDAMLNYGDAVGHLHIARRVLDARFPRLTELGSVWLPLPHILMMPFAANFAWWANGLAGVIPSALAYIASCAGLYRLARNWLSPAASALALTFFALNPNLLYLQTTAMTEPLFLCEVIWAVAWLAEWRISLDHEPARSARLPLAIAAVLIAAVFTRYDGWILACIAWTGMGVALYRRGRLRYSPYFWLASVAVVAAPIAWFVYNSVGFGDWLYFARGPYSAKAIELRTATHGAGPLHPGWHNPWVGLLFFVKVAELDAVLAPAWKSLWGNITLALAAAGTVAAWFAEKAEPTGAGGQGTAGKWLGFRPFASAAKTAAAFAAKDGISADGNARRSALGWVALLWLPAPFYAWSVAYGWVPIFLPAWWPFSDYNTRYGMELLPALALGVGFAANAIATALDRWQGRRFAQFLPELAYTTLFLLVGVNAAVLLRQGPIVYTEGWHNLEARLPFDEALPPFLREMLSASPHATVLMNTSVYPEIVAFTGIPLRQTINESDQSLWQAALLAPASHAAIVVAWDGDAVDCAVKAHPEGLAVAGRFAAKGQPSATVYYAKAAFAQRTNPLLAAPSSAPVALHAKPSSLSTEP